MLIDLYIVVGAVAIICAVSVAVVLAFCRISYTTDAHEEEVLTQKEDEG